ncbi:bifunctional adenosylcobinamide kinase/adenosylcobinamide-phosphate guanylyltransferase [Roseibium denhamense]|uniref:Bifunctional adenosylcobalamin biosynthesis protein n=1 Tax=Roseibium denhamense TaxID=76305 RepID=A0ABY1PD93_9HYPH|nr:bifunctional adenosylcobinamide kinase/adenosylcobinamide-phosphate guanylyltransferase [Roseibium denhamense]MTI07824.1 bifunctional adenosylcobinamide kinase/adenosylcobinamide-phosphate guanylyltransferase [Roseibium denhamense]SMP31885.1 adenosylcobinamide kinase /adenosylcobinamide-phosphate guanylyltransferase [Roseibium denhamense]
MTQSDRRRSTLVFGGARSGKSTFAEHLAVKSGLEKVYVATGAAFDTEMADRIAMHKDQRGPAWVTIEEQLDIAGVLAREVQPERIILLDCLTLWLSNLMFAGKDIAQETARLIEAVRSLQSPCIFVSNEVGMGIVPENRLSRSFRDEQGRLNQTMAECCDQVVFVAAGQPLLLKPNHQPDIES